MNKVSLFSGIGGDDIASEWAGFETVCFVENNVYCQKVLRKHWPDVPIISEVKDVTKERIQEIMADTERARRYAPITITGSNGFSDGETFAENAKWEEKITIVSGGFPCQPHSVAGKREGSADERNLWPEFRRIIGEIKPRWVLAENVPGLFSSDSRRFFGTILSDLAEMGYSVGWSTYGAVDVGALHRRNRVFIVAYARLLGQTECQEQTAGIEQPSEGTGDVADTNRERLQGHRGLPECGGQWLTWKGDTALKEIWESEPDVGRVAHGVPSRVDRLKALGNAVVPQQVYLIYKAIAEIERSRD